MCVCLCVCCECSTLYINTQISVSISLSGFSHHSFLWNAMIPMFDLLTSALNLLCVRLCALNDILMLKDTEVLCTYTHFYCCCGSSEAVLCVLPGHVFIYVIITQHDIYLCVCLCVQLGFLILAVEANISSFRNCSVREKHILRSNSGSMFQLPFWQKHVNRAT